MIIKYKINEQIKQTDISNDDLSILIDKNENNFKVSLTALKDVLLLDAFVEFSYKYNKENKIFVNGYQSWTDSKEFYLNEKVKNVKKLPSFLVNMFAFDKYGDSFFYKYNKDVIHGFDISYIKGLNGLFIANNNRDAYLIIEHHIKDNKIQLHSDIKNLSLKANQQIVLFDYMIENGIEKGQELYFNNYKCNSNKKIFGYTSWYNYYQDINEEKINQNLIALDDRFNLFQIDDGYETFIGDWLDVDPIKFPNGLKEIVKNIHERKMLAGIWLAPFVAEKDSNLFKNHPEYFKKDKDNNFIKCGCNWSGFYALDFEKEEVKEYISKCLNYYMDLGFDFFKLDFLYAISVPTYENKTRCQIANEAYMFLRSILKDKLILGCGATLLNSFGVFDYLRIGPDVSLKFDDVWFMKYMHRERISTKITLQNTIYRFMFNNKVFLNDPDVFLLRDDNIELSKEQKQALLLINALFGSVLMTSDNINSYDNEKQEYLNYALKLNNCAKVKSYERKNDDIIIVYNVDDIDKTIVYNTKKGVMTNG